MTLERPGVRTDEERLTQLARLSEALQGLSRSALDPSWKQNEALLLRELMKKAK